MLKQLAVIMHFKNLRSRILEFELLLVKIVFVLLKITLRLVTLLRIKAETPCHTYHPLMKRGQHRSINKIYERQKYPI